RAAYSPRRLYASSAPARATSRTCPSSAPAKSTNLPSKLKLRSRASGRANLLCRQRKDVLRLRCALPRKPPPIRGGARLEWTSCGHWVLFRFAPKMRPLRSHAGVCKTALPEEERDHDLQTRAAEIRRRRGRHYACCAGHRASAQEDQLPHMEHHRPGADDSRLDHALRQRQARRGGRVA